MTMRRDETTYETGTRTCPRCGDPQPVDGRCDCAGDADRDYATGHRELRSPHMQLYRLTDRDRRGDLDAVVEVWA